ncbi:Flp pilus assembly protein CpaB [Rhodobacter ferrooxidans]|uniref:Flp pilus assembly protein CpaB n=1 Tax=Rhodobacter ferrooxidans TaxID=371731 RepID=C8RXS9_9RHOB|nr:Flp pilus assembly protein CpaB [Rhodobacter sp. SW2]EEW26327.1 Flp pilus assembly protein CpaB [Rhodobacter sp. SW2]
MRMVFGLVLVVGLALAGFAVYMAQGFISQTQAELAQERAARAKAGPLVEVYVVNKPLNYGDPLTKEDVQKIYWPQNALPETIFTDEALLFPANAVGQRFVLRQMEKFEPLLAVKVTEPGQDAGLTARLAKGMRAFAIKVDATSGVSGFLHPGDNVDVYWTGTANDAGVGGEMTRLIESTIKIIAVDQMANDDRSGSAVVAATVTVEASPEEVARLAQAQATGKLALSLVGANDASVAGLVEVDSRSLLGIEQQAAAEVPVAERVCSVKTRKGADVVDIPIPCTN